MRRVLLSALILVAAACSGNGGGSIPVEAPELLRAVPSDALAVGIFNRCERATSRMLDSTSVINKLDLSYFRKHKAVLALCDVGSVSPLLIVETGKAGQNDTLPQTAALARQADSLQVFSAQVELDRHTAILLSPSATIITVARRHLVSESSILDAPYFDQVLEAIGTDESIVWRNSGAAKLFPLDICSIPRKQLTGFIRNAAEWTVASGNRLKTVQPQSEKYFCNFLDAAGEGQSRLSSACPEDAELIIDLPIGDAKQWRRAYETMLDARVELESYNKRIDALRKSAGKSPLDWEKVIDIQEIVYVACKDYSINMTRTARPVKSVKEGQVCANSASGFINALYGSPFIASDSCCIRRGNWLVSGPRSVLDTLSLGSLKNWPSRACAIVQIPGERLCCTKENITLWQDSNR